MTIFFCAIDTLPIIYLLKQHVRYLVDLVDKPLEPFSSLMCGRVLVVDIVDTLVTLYLLKQHMRYLVDLVDKPYRALFKSYVWSCIGG